MIGTPRSRDERGWEVHAGFSLDDEVQRQSLALASRVGAMAGRVAGGLPPPQLYPLAGGDGKDPGEERSDHYSFLRRRYPACLVCEDFFPGPGTAPAAPSEHYHKATDVARFVDSEYAAEIARAVAAAAWITATIP